MTRYYSAADEWYVPTDWTAPTPLPTVEQYADAERLLRARCDRFDPLAATLRCWIADTKPLAVKAGWNDGYEEEDRDRRILADLAAATPRPPLWTRIGDGWIAAGVVVLLGVLLALPLVYS